MKVIITGATRGIGKAIAIKFAQQGASIAFCGRHADSVRMFEDYLKNTYNAAVFGYLADVADKQQARQFAHDAQITLNGCDILINNAGMYMPGSIELESDGVFENQMAVNLNSAYYMSQALIPALKKGTRPHIFNMCSIASLVAYPNGSSYCISKFALLGLTKILREELKPAGVAVTAVMPGATLTESWGDTDLPESRFILPENIADSIWNAWMINENTVVEEMVLRPIAGDI